MQIEEKINKKFPNSEMMIYKKTRNRKNNKSMTLNPVSRVASHQHSTESLKLPDILRTRKISRDDSMESMDKLEQLKAKRTLKKNQSNHASLNNLHMNVTDEQDLIEKLHQIEKLSPSPKKTNNLDGESND